MESRMTRRNFLKKTSGVATLAGLSGCGILLQGCRSKKEFDVVIKDGWIVNGRGNERFKADIGISGDSIKSIGKISSGMGKSVIHAKDLVISPGFVDVHDHTDVQLLVNSKAESSIHEGVTTLISGNCGSSPFPIADEIYEQVRESLLKQFEVELNWRDIKGFFGRLEEKGIALNYATLVGHGAVRGAAMGFNDRPPKTEEMETMKALVEENIRNGAVGLSTGLEYAPGSFAQADEITELCEVVARLGGVYATHMRDEGDRLIESLDETIDVARRTGVSLEISHFKIAYPRNWHKVEEAIARVEKARDEGVKIFCDRYPYTAGATGLSFYFPLWSRQGTTEEFLSRLKDPFLDSKLRAHVADQENKLGSWDKVVISSVASEQNRHLQGKNILEASQEAQKEPYVFMRDLLIEEENQVGMIIFMMTEDNLKRILSHPLVGVGADGEAIAPYGILGKGKPHPRLYGTFPRVLEKYVREEKILPLETMVMKMTSMASQKFGLERRGVVENGYYADLVLFNPETIIDRATWENPHQYPGGIEYVLVNGQVVIEKGEHTGNLPGKVLRRKVNV